MKLVLILFGVAVVGPPLLGFLLYLRSKLTRNPLSFEDGILRGYQIAYTDRGKKF